MSLIFKPNNFYSNYRDVNDINSIAILEGNLWKNISFNEKYNFTTQNDSLQKFKIRVIYNGNDTIINETAINTIYFDDNIGFSSQKSLGSCDLTATFSKCKDCIKITHHINNQDLKLKACLIPSCSEFPSNSNVKKPFILVTGYRPPIFGQSFSKTWKLYSDDHQSFLQELHNMDFDIYIVKFNIHNKPQTHGMLEASDLFIEFLEYVNNNKTDSYIENVISASSMSADIVNLALLKMESMHFNNNQYPHHHSRLFISYDGNFHGANLPLSYQYQIYSGALRPTYGGLFTPDALGTFLQTYLYASLEQKTVKELLMYHADANNLTNSFFEHSTVTEEIIPDMHQKRKDYLNTLYSYYNGNKSFPIPYSRRNIAVSLGKIYGLNNWSNDNGRHFLAAGEYWRNDDGGVFFTSKIRSSIFTTNYTNIFERRKIGLNFFPFSVYVNHSVNVKEMQEVDVSAGSYLKGISNIIQITSVAYPDPTVLLFHSNYVATHKPVVSAFAINKNLWPTDASMTLNMQSLGLMYNVLNFDPINDLSNHYGYPNLGRPNDHFDVTPFEAIYVDPNINEHIKLGGTNQTDLEILNNYLYNEIEPWYLALQNQELGSQARPNYIYKSKRIAKYGIDVGYLVTPKTDPGNFSTESNSDLILNAGQYINLHIGTEFLPGSTVTAEIKFPFSRNCFPGGGAKTKENSEKTLAEQNILFKEQFLEDLNVNCLELYPNPNNGTFTLTAIKDKKIQSYSIYNCEGNLIWERKKINLTKVNVDVDSPLNKGCYIIIANIDGEIYRRKTIVL